jgi:hypothetical protein
MHREQFEQSLFSRTTITIISGFIAGGRRLLITELQASADLLETLLDVPFWCVLVRPNFFLSSFAQGWRLLFPASGYL